MEPGTGDVVTPIQLDLLSTILVAFVVLFAGQTLIARSAFLARFSIPAPVVGGVLVGDPPRGGWTSSAGSGSAFDMALRDNLLLMFFTTVGLSADARMLRKGRTEAVRVPAGQHRVHRGPERRRHRGGPGDGPASGRRPARRLHHAHGRPRHGRRLWRPLRRHDEHRRRDGADDGLRDGGARARQPARRSAGRVPRHGGTSWRRPAAAAATAADGAETESRPDHVAVGPEYAVRDPGVPGGRQDARAAGAGHRPHPAGFSVLPAAGSRHPQRGELHPRHACQQRHRRPARRRCAVAVPGHGADGHAAGRSRQPGRPAARHPDAAG